VTQVDQWLTLKEAAEAMGCSVVTLRRMIKRNTVQARQVDTPNGRAWRVLSSSLISLPRVHVAQADHSLITPPDQGPAMLELVRLVAQLQDDKARMAQRIGFLEAQLSLSESRLAALEAPKAEPAAAEPTAAATETVSEPATAPWWRRVWRAVQV
jgi:excisionase family DNA binding protein